MNEIRLLNLAIDNFKGQRHVRLDFDGQNASIYGDNATGKTTLYDAVTWLLFGKDSRGQSDFEVKPLGTDGKVLDHAAITSVEAAFCSADGEISLRKTYYEKWSTRRGGAVETFDGNTSDYFVDDVPAKKYEYERRVSELVSEDVFRMLTGVTCFCLDMDWRERRKVLFDVCGVATDREIMSGSEQFSHLLEAMGRLSLDDYKKKILAERKGLSGARSDVPVRLDECQKTVEELAGLDFDALRTDRNRLNAKREKLSAELLKLEHNSLLDSKYNEQGKLQNQLVMLRNENAAHRNGQLIPPGDDGAGLRRELDTLMWNINRWSMERAATAQSIKQSDREVDHCRLRWAEINARQFAGGACPTCGQVLTGALLDRANAQFELEKSTQLNDVVADAQRFKERAVRETTQKEALEGEIAEGERRSEELSGLIAALKPIQPPEILDLPNFAANCAELSERISALNTDIAAISGESGSIQAETRAKIAAFSEEITTIDGTLYKEEILRFTKERMDKLREEAREAAVRIEALDEALFLCEAFTRHKTHFIEDTINSRFQLAQFRLFVEQVNGGLSDCCDVTCGGVPYGSLNSGARINVGMDVIATLSEHYGVRVPLFVDNAESVTALAGAGTQAIRLVVSAQDKELRCKHEG